MKTLFTLFTLTLITYIATSQAQSPAPNGFVSICTLDENCAVEGSVLVAFGSGEQFVYKTLAGEFICNGKTFDIDTQTADTPNPQCSVIDPGSNSSQHQSSSTPDSPSMIADGEYAIVSRFSGKALTVVDGGLEDGAGIQQQDFNQLSNQIWNIESLGNGYYSFTASHSGKTLENLDWDSKDGGEIQQLPWINGWSQHWTIQFVDNTYVKILSRTSGQALDVYELNTKDRGHVVMWTYWGGENQHWLLVPISEDVAIR